MFVLVTSHSLAVNASDPHLPPVLSQAVVCCCPVRVVQVTVDVPDQKGRLEILQVHARNKKLDQEVDLLVSVRGVRRPGRDGHTPFCVGP